MRRSVIPLHPLFKFYLAVVMSHWMISELGLEQAGPRYLTCCQVGSRLAKGPVEPIFWKKHLEDLLSQRGLSRFPLSEPSMKSYLESHPWWSGGLCLRIGFRNLGRIFDSKFNNIYQTSDQSIKMLQDMLWYIHKYLNPGFFWRELKNDFKLHGWCFIHRDRLVIHPWLNSQKSKLPWSLCSQPLRLSCH
jgi:hypothetical protein